MDSLVDVKELENFLMGFCDRSRPPGEQYKYVQGLHAINSRESRILTIELDDLAAYSKNDASTSELNCVSRAICIYVGTCLTHCEKRSSLSFNFLQNHN